MRRIIVIISLILLVMGAVLYVISTQETHSETVNVDHWNLHPSILGPQNSTFYGRLMKPGMWFRLNISSSEGPVKVAVSYSVAQESKVPIFEEVGSSFSQQVPIPHTATWWVDIKNENSFAVTLGGSILVQQGETRHRTIYPYAFPGVLLMLAGAGALIFGIFKRPERPPRLKGGKKRP